MSSWSARVVRASWTSVVSIDRDERRPSENTTAKAIILEIVMASRAKDKTVVRGADQAEPRVLPPGRLC